MIRPGIRRRGMFGLASCGRTCRGTSVIIFLITRSMFGSLPCGSQGMVFSFYKVCGGWWVPCDVGGVVLIFKAHPRTVGVTPLIGRFRGCPRRFGAVMYIANRRHRVLSRILRVFSVAPSCSLGVVGRKRSLCSIATHILAKVQSILGRTRPSIILIRNSAAASATSTLTTFCRRVPIKRMRTKLHARGVCDP